MKRLLFAIAIAASLARSVPAADLSVVSLTGTNASAITLTHSIVVSATGLGVRNLPIPEARVLLNVSPTSTLTIAQLSSNAVISLSGSFTTVTGTSIFATNLLATTFTFNGSNIGSIVTSLTQSSGASILSGTSGAITLTGTPTFVWGNFTTSLSSPVATLTSLVSTSATVSTLTLSGATVNRSVVTGTGGVLSAGALLHSTDDVKLIGTSTLGLYSGSATFAQVYSGSNRGLSLAANNGNGVNGLYLGGDSLAYVGLGTVTPSSGFDNNRSVALGAIQNLAADTTLTPANVAYCATLTGAITATLASPANIPRREIYFVNVGSVTATLAAPAGGNIMGNTTLSIPAGGNISVISATVGGTNVWIKKSQGL